MERRYERIEVARKALIAFDEVMQIAKPTTIERDAAIQRFEFTFALEMANDRNRSLHTYNESLAIEIYGRLSTYLGLLTLWLDRLKAGRSA